MIFFFHLHIDFVWNFVRTKTFEWEYKNCRSFKICRSVFLKVEPLRWESVVKRVILHCLQFFITLPLSNMISPNQEDWVQENRVRKCLIKEDLKLQQHFVNVTLVLVDDQVHEGYLNKVWIGVYSTLNSPFSSFGEWSVCGFWLIHCNLLLQ